MKARPTEEIPGTNQPLSKNPSDIAKENAHSSVLGLLNRDASIERICESCELSKRFATFAKLIRDSADINAKNDNNRSLFDELRGLVYWGKDEEIDANMEIISLVLSRQDIPINADDSHFPTIFVAACRQGRNDIIRILLERDDLDTAGKGSNEDKTGYSWAVHFGRIDTVKLLLQHPRTNIQPEESIVAIRNAFLRGQFELAKAIFELVKEALGEMEKEKLAKGLQGYETMKISLDRISELLNITDRHCGIYNVDRDGKCRISALGGHFSQLLQLCSHPDNVITHLVFREQDYITLDDLRSLGEALSHPNNKIESIELYCCSLGKHEQGMEFIADGLKNEHCKLKSLSLSDNVLDPNQLATIIKAAGSEGNKLEILDLSGNSMGGRNFYRDARSIHYIRTDLPGLGAEEISTMLANPNCKLRELWIGMSRFTEIELSLLLGSLRSPSNNLRLLGMPMNRIGEFGLNMLSQTLQDANCKLEKLHIGAHGDHFEDNVEWYENLFDTLSQEGGKVSFVRYLGRNGDIIEAFKKISEKRGNFEFEHS